MTLTVVVLTIAPVAASVPVTVKVKAPVPTVVVFALPPHAEAPTARSSRATIANQLRRREGSKKNSNPASTAPPAVPNHLPR